MEYRPLSVETLPQVFINLLALENEGIVIFTETLNESEEMKTWFATTKIPNIRIEREYEDDEMYQRTRRNLADFFVAIILLSLQSRSFFVKDFERILNELGRSDFWGTEGQCDPRGDRRDEDLYR